MFSARPAGGKTAGSCCGNFQEAGNSDHNSDRHLLVFRSVPIADQLVQAAVRLRYERRKALRVDSAHRNGFVAAAQVGNFKRAYPVRLVEYPQNGDVPRPDFSEQPLD